MRALLLLLLAVGARAAGPVEVPAGKVQDQIRGGLLGHVLGDLNGLKHEMKYIAEPGNVESYVPALPGGAWTDDDTDVEWVYVLDMQRSGTLLLPPARIAELWKRHINRRIWCSHLYLRQLLDIGILPPLTGSARLNPWADFNLSAQFVSESWGLISPGMPQTAARIGTHYTHVSIDGEPIQSTQLFDAMIASAFFTSDIDRILDAGVAAMDPSSEMRQVVVDVRRWHREHPGDWRATRARLREKYALYGGQDMRDRNGVKLNGGSAVAALLYGRGDWIETVRHAFNFGWDADNNAAAAGAIVGVLKGWKWMTGQGWNIRDIFRNTSRDRMPDDETLTKFGDRLIALMEWNLEQHGGGKATVNGRTVYRIRTEDSANVEPLRRDDPDVGPEIEAGMRPGATAEQQARAAYLAICLDRASALRQTNEEAWVRAVRALEGYPRLIQAMFYQAPIPAGEKIREKAVAAGVARPAKADMFQ